MHIYFSGIGGSGMSALALLAKQAGFDVSGSDQHNTAYVKYLRKHDITDITIGQSYEFIAAVHARHPIDWLVYSSAVSVGQSGSSELRFCNDHDIKISKRDEFLNTLLAQTKQKLVAIAGTHGKSTTTAMVVWLCKELGLPISYLIGAKVSFGDSSEFNHKSEYFIYECDEFDRNFLAFHPHISAITGLSWDHHEIFPTRNDYNQAFRDFIRQSQHTFAYESDLQELGLTPNNHTDSFNQSDPAVHTLRLIGHYNRLDAWLAMHVVARLTHKPVDRLQSIVDRFPGLSQRMEQLVPNLYTNYAHTPEKIKGGMSAALEIAQSNGQDLVIIYEPLTNRRQHHIKQDYKDCFAGAKKIYWVPTYLAREDPNQPLLTPQQLIPYLNNASMAEPATFNDDLAAHIKKHLAQGNLVVAMGASGPGSLDEWLRAHFASNDQGESE